MIGRVTGIVLAAGTSSRLGQPKQLLDFEGRPLLQHAIDAMEGAGLVDIVVVLGHRADEVAEAVETGPDTRIVVNPDYAQGQATSLRAGLGAAVESSDAAVVILGDQPAVGPLHVRTVVETYFATGGKVVQAAFGGKPNHPTLFERSLWPELEAIEGDQGAREVLKKHPEWVVRVEFGGELPQDLDTREDYERLTGKPLPGVQLNLAESIQFTGPEIALILALLLLSVLAVVGVVVAGCILARRAARGSQTSLVLWGVVALCEIGFVIYGMAAGGEFIALVAAGALVLQVALYLTERTRTKT